MPDRTAGRTAELGAAKPRRRASSGALRELLPPVAASFSLLLLWQFLTLAIGIPEHLLPSPLVILSEMATQAPLLSSDAAVTGAETLAAVGLSVAVACPLALAFVYIPALERAFYPLLVSTQAIPKVAIAPLFVVWFGFGLGSKVLIAFLVAFFPLIINSVAGLKSVSPEYVQLIRSMGAGEAEVLRRVRVPSSLPHFFAGLKVAVTLAIIGAIVGEFMGADSGLGYRLLFANGFLDTKLLFATIVLLSAMGIILFYAVTGVEKLLIPWHVSQMDDTSATP